MPLPLPCPFWGGCGELPSTPLSKGALSGAPRTSCCAFWCLLPPRTQFFAQHAKSYPSGAYNPSVAVYGKQISSRSFRTHRAIPCPFLSTLQLVFPLLGGTKYLAYDSRSTLLPAHERFSSPGCRHTNSGANTHNDYIILSLIAALSL